ncbi:hypothetical protein [Rhizobium tubonense]|uniref:Uncharacterized protein n=1 Tax=Rhizobium tubonense TaxID=484088 RepID=A0A2W4CRN5_9HYPH|nr:hypothetical protein [Rhizobium tubonense]PZM08084.1 hypothetical protein CPY51_30545 [Rhizobium tubonense]
MTAESVFSHRRHVLPTLLDSSVQSSKRIDTLAHGQRFCQAPLTLDIAMLHYPRLLTYAGAEEFPTAKIRRTQASLAFAF